MKTPHLKYAGIGSRDTPEQVYHLMYSLAQQLALKGWMLRSGHAQGADTAFELGCLSQAGMKEIFLPWVGFNSAPTDHQDYIRRPVTADLLAFAEQYHPNWSACNEQAKLMHARNGCQVLGYDGDDPVHMVLCWTKNGKGGGGTGQAIRIAKAYNIPVFDLALLNAQMERDINTLVESLEADQ